MLQELTLTGDRQMGKSYGAMVLAIDAARRGEQVIYDCDNSREVAQRFLDLQRLSPTHELIRVVRSNGKEQIDFCTGGRIRVINARAGGGRGIVADMHVIDHDQDEGEANPTVQRVIRTRLVPTS